MRTIPCRKYSIVTSEMWEQRLRGLRMFGMKHAYCKTRMLTHSPDATDHDIVFIIRQSEFYGHPEKTASRFWSLCATFWPQTMLTSAARMGYRQPECNQGQAMTRGQDEKRKSSFMCASVQRNTASIM